MQYLKSTFANRYNKPIESWKERTTGSFLTKSFNNRNRKFPTVTWTQPNYADFLLLKTIGLATFLIFSRINNNKKLTK